MNFFSLDSSSSKSFNNIVFLKIGLNISVFLNQARNLLTGQFYIKVPHTFTVVLISIVVDHFKQKSVIEFCFYFLFLETCLLVEKVKNDL